MPKIGKCRNPVFDSSPFVTSFVLYAFSHLDRASIGEMANKALAFLRAEMEFGGVWRYWSSRQQKHARLPPDLDDTSCISYALGIMGDSIPRNRWAFRCARDPQATFSDVARADEAKPIDAAVPVRTINRLLPGAPVRKRSRPRTNGRSAIRTMHIVRDDVDPVVNANVILYLGECAETALAIQYVIKTVQNQGRRLACTMKILLPCITQWREPIAMLRRGLRH